mgnify:CR=1 FL=1
MIFAYPFNSPTTTNASSLNVQAYKVSGSAPGTLTIYLNTTSATSALLTSGALHYAACESTACPSDLTQVSSSTSGTITATGKKALLTDELSATSKTYYVYFWLDSEDVDDNVIGSSYSGYISAEAIQTDSDNS